MWSFEAVAAHHTVRKSKIVKTIGQMQKTQVTFSSAFSLHLPACFEKWTLNALPFMNFVRSWRSCTAQGLRLARICNSTWHSRRDLLCNFRPTYLQRKPCTPLCGTVLWKFHVLGSIGLNSQQNNHKRKTNMICDGTYSRPCILIYVHDSSM